MSWASRLYLLTNGLRPFVSANANTDGTVTSVMPDNADISTLSQLSGSVLTLSQRESIISVGNDDNITTIQDESTTLVL